MSRIQTFSLESMRRIAKEVFREEREADHIKHPAVLTLNTHSPFDYQHDFSQELQFRNVSGEEIPPYAVMRFTGVETRNGLPVYTAAKPDDTFHPLYLVNGPLRVSSEATAYGFGRFLLQGPGRVLASTSIRSPSYGDRWGPVSGEWHLIAGNQGFILANATTGTTATYGLTYIWAQQDPIRNKTVAFVNDSGETIPPFAIMKMENDFDTSGRMRVTKPDTTFQRLYLVNGAHEVLDTKGGHGTHLTDPANDLGRARYSASPTMMSEWGAKPGEWELYPNRPGFAVLGNPVDLGGGVYSARTFQREVTRLEGYLIDGAIGALDSATFKHYSGTTAASVDAGFTALTCWNSGCEAILNSGDDLWGAVNWCNSEWRFEPICCPTGEES